jgi:hypothetical protein
MKMNEIKVGTTYAIASSKYEREPNSYDGRRGARRGIVREVGIRRRVWEGCYSYLSARADGVKVDLLHNDGTVLRTEEIPATHVFMEWDAYIAEETENVRRFAERAAARLSDHKDAAARLASLQEVLGDRAKLPWWASGKVYGDGSFTKEGKVTLNELASLLEAAYAAGREAKS